MTLAGLSRCGVWLVDAWGNDDAPDLWQVTIMTRADCLVMPDIEEARMLRALVLEGVMLARRSPYTARFHEWIVRVSRDGTVEDAPRK